MLKVYSHVDALVFMQSAMYEQVGLNRSGGRKPLEFRVPLTISKELNLMINARLLSAPFVSGAAPGFVRCKFARNPDKPLTTFCIVDERFGNYTLRNPKQGAGERYKAKLILPSDIIQVTLPGFNKDCRARLLLWKIQIHAFEGFRV